MACMAQRLKQEIVAEVKKVLPKDWKVTFKVDHYSELRLIVRKIPKSDLLAMAYDTEKDCFMRLQEEGNTKEDIANFLIKGCFLKSNIENLENIYLDFHVLPRLSKESYNKITSLDKKKDKTKILLSLIEALNSFNEYKNNHERDCANFGYYTRLSFGEWNKPCKLI